MKRSEAIEKISLILAPLVPGYDYRLADKILNELEEEGMIPPVADTWGTRYWEPENEDNGPK